MPGQGKLHMIQEREPRRQHYFFAHYVLPGLIFENIDTALETFSNPNVDILLQRLWAIAVPEGSTEPPILPTSLAVSEFSPAPGVRLFVFSLPQPVAMTEAFFTALACMTANSKPMVRYFTLELGFSQTHALRTVIGEWTPDRSHVNYGDGPEPTAEAFVSALERFWPGTADN